MNWVGWKMNTNFAAHKKLFWKKLHKYRCYNGKVDENGKN